MDRVLFTLTHRKREGKNKPSGLGKAKRIQREA